MDKCYWYLNFLFILFINQLKLWMVSKGHEQLIKKNKNKGHEHARKNINSLNQWLGRILISLGATNQMCTAQQNKI